MGTDDDFRPHPHSLSSPLLSPILHLLLLLEVDGLSVHLARSVLFLFPPSSAVLSLQVNFELAHHRFPAALRRPALPSISPSSIPFTITICSHINQRQTRPDLRSYSPSASVVARRIQQQQVFATPIL